MLTFIDTTLQMLTSSFEIFTYYRDEATLKEKKLTMIFSVAILVTWQFGLMAAIGFLVAMMTIIR